MFRTPQSLFVLAISGALGLLVLESPAFSEVESLNYRMMKLPPRPSLVSKTGKVARMACDAMPCAPTFTDSETQKTLPIRGTSDSLAMIENALTQAQIANVILRGYMENTAAGEVFVVASAQLTD